MIRAATSQDVKAIAGIELAAFGTAAWSEALVGAEVGGPRRAVLIDVGLRAYGAISIIGDVADLDRIATVPSARGQGLARHLLEALVDRTRDLGAERMLLEVAADNLIAIALYESMGFDTISTRASYYPDGIDALVMELAIAEWQ